MHCGTASPGQVLLPPRSTVSTHPARTLPTPVPRPLPGTESNSGPHNATWSPSQVEGGSNHKAGVEKGSPGEAHVTRGQGADSQEFIPGRQEGRQAREAGLQESKGSKSLGSHSIVPLDFTYRNRIKGKITNNFKIVNIEH